MPGVGGGGTSKQFQIEFLLKIQDAATAVLKQVQAEIDKVGKGAQDAGQAVQKSMNGMAASATNAAQRLEQMSGSLFAIGAAASGVGVTLTAAFKGIIGTAAGFEDTMNGVKAITNATESEFKRLVATARKLGAETAFSNKEAAEGMKYLGQAGYDTEQIIATLPHVLNLAEANSMNLGQAADYVAGIMQGFGLKAEDAVRATDVLAMTANMSATDVNQLAEAMKYVGPTSRAMGQSIEEASAAVGVLSQNGIKASMAGTNLRRVMLQLAAPTTEGAAALQKMGVQVVKNQDGNVNLIQTLKRLRDARMSATEAEQIFGVYAISAGIALANDVDKLEEFTQKNNNAAGALNKVVTIMRAGFSKAIERMASAFETLLDLMGAPLLEPLKRVVDTIAAVISKMAEWAEAHPQISGAIAGFIGVAGLVAGVIGAIGIALAGIGFIMKPFTQGWLFLKQTMIGWVESASMIVGTSARTKNALVSEGAQVDALAQKYNAATAAKQKMNTVPTTGGVAPSTAGGKSKGGMAAGAAVVVGGIAAGELAKAKGLEETGAALESMAGIAGTLLFTFSALKETITGLASGISVAGAATTGVLAAGAYSWAKVFYQDIYDLLDVLGVAQEKIEKTRTVFSILANPFGALMQMLGVYPKQTEAAAKEAAIKATKAQEEAGKKAEQDKAEAVKREMQSLDDRFKELQKDAEARRKVDETVHKERLREIDIESAQEKVAISERIQSNQEEQDALLQLEINTQARRTAEVQKQSALRMKAEQEAYEAQKAILQQQLETAGDDKGKTEAKKKLTDLERKHAQEQIKIQTDLTEQLGKELEAQLKKRAEYVNKIQELENKLRETQRNSAQLLRNLEIQSADQYAQLDMKLSDANAKLREATELFPKYPERAVDLAKQAQSEFASLGQNLATLREQLKNNLQAVQDAIRDVQNIGLKGMDKYYADRDSVLMLMERARQEQAAGRLKEAEALYKQAIGQAKSLASGAPENVRGEAQADAIRMLLVIFKRLQDINNQQVTKAEEVNQSVRDGIREAGALLEENIKKQIESTQKLIEALDRNTESTKQRYEEAKAQGQASGGPGEPSGESRGHSYAEQDKQAEDAARNDDLNRKMRETSADLDKADKGVDDYMNKKTSSYMSSALSGVNSQINTLRDNLTAGVQGRLERYSESGAGSGVAGALGKAIGGLAEPVNDMKAFGAVLREVAQVFLRAKEMDSNINITVNADGSVSMSRGGGQYDNY